MSSLEVFYNNMWFASFTALVHSIIFNLAKPYFVGFGGKLGTLGMISCLIGSLLPYAMYGRDYSYPIHDKTKYEVMKFIDIIIFINKVKKQKK